MTPRFGCAQANGLMASVVLSAGLSVACNRVPFLLPSGSTIVLASAATALPINGSAEILAQVVVASGTPPQRGTHVLFATTLGSVDPSEAETDSGGRVTVRFHAGTTSGIATITAFSGGASVDAEGAVRIAIGAAAVGRIAVSATPGTVPASGGSAKVVALVVDLNGNPLGGTTVTFTTTAGSLSQGVVTTDTSGNAETSLTTRQQATVTATAGTQGTTGGGTGTGTGSQTSATVTVNLNQPALITVGAPSPTTAIVGQTVTFPITFGSGASFVRVTADFGDGSAQTIVGMPSTVSHAYSQTGTFLARVTGVDAFGDTQSGSSSSGVTVTNRPQPSVTIALASGSPAPRREAVTTFTLTSTPSGGTSSPNVITSIVVNFGDGESVSLSGNASSVSHVYHRSGTFTVTATATDSAGATGSGSTVIVVVD